MNQSEKVLVVSQSTLQMTSRKRRHYDGTNRGNVIGPVGLPSFDSPDVWKLPIPVKKELLGNYGATIPVGGTLPVPAEVMKRHNEQQALMRGSKISVPVFYHAPPRMLLEELAHGYNLQAFFTLTFGDGALAMVALRARKPICGICLTPKHKELALALLEAQVWKAMCSEGDKLSEPGLIALLKETPGGLAENDEEEEAADGSSEKKKGARKSQRKRVHAKDVSNFNNI